MHSYTANFTVVLVKQQEKIFDEQELDKDTIRSIKTLFDYPELVPSCF